LFGIIILNEIEYAKDLIESGAKDKDPYSYIPILSKYYRQILKYTPKKTANEIDSFMTTNYINYNSVRWVAFIDSCVKKSKKQKLSNIQFVGVTQKELDIIDSSTQNTTHAKVLFSLLCVAKYFNVRSETNNNWTNLKTKDIFRMANVNTSIEKQDRIIHELYKSSSIGISKKVDNLNIRVLCVDNTTDFVLQIGDFRNLGYEYMNWKKGGYFRCAECGALQKQNKYGNRIYCNKCVGNSPMLSKTIKCVDCGREFKIDSKDNQTDHCPECYKKYRAEKNKEKYRKYNVKRRA